jgi:NADH:ubiquinone oxidoreductase subunit 6 (subunit J)
MIGSFILTSGKTGVGLSMMFIGLTGASVTRKHLSDDIIKHSKNSVVTQDKKEPTHVLKEEIQISQVKKGSNKTLSELKSGLDGLLKFFLVIFGILVVVVVIVVIGSIFSDGSSDNTSSAPVTPECTKEVDVFMESQKLIKSSLTAPSTAKFAGILSSVIDKERHANSCIYGVKSHVDSQNAFGATLTTEYLYVVEISDDGTEKVLHLEVNGKTLINR